MKDIKFSIVKENRLENILLLPVYYNMFAFFTVRFKKFFSKCLFFIF